VHENLLEIDELTVSFTTEEGRVLAVDRASLALPRGSVVAIVGESGSGKSVTAYSILRLIQKPGKIEGGRITFHSGKGESLDILRMAENSEQLYQLRGGWVSMIFQEPMSALSPVHTVGNQICEAILLHRDYTRQEAEERAIEMLDKVGIPDPAIRLRQYPYELSGGMRQRVVIAMALVCEPELLIADEPTTALDVTLQAQVIKLIKDLRQDLGTSVLFITHDIGVVAQIADYVAVMYQGRVVETGPVRDVLKDPLHPYTQGLLAAIPGMHPGARRLPTIDSFLRKTPFDIKVDLRPAAPGRQVALPENNPA